MTRICLRVVAHSLYLGLLAGSETSSDDKNAVLDWSISCNAGDGWKRSCKIDKLPDLGLSEYGAKPYQGDCLKPCVFSLSLQPNICLLSKDSK
jgi:hypothetical protein